MKSVSLLCVDVGQAQLLSGKLLFFFNPMSPSVLIGQQVHNSGQKSLHGSLSARLRGASEI